MRFRFRQPARLTLLAALFSFAAATAQDTREAKLLAQIDEILGPSEAFRMDVSVTVQRRNAAPLLTRFEMLADGRDHTLLRTLQPEGDRGRNVLYEGRIAWAYLPTVRRPFQVSLTQRLTGEVSNGDIARSHLARDYRILSDELQSLSGQRCRLLTLQSKSPEVAYPKVSLWVDEKTHHPVQAEFFAVSGRLLKKCTYEGYVLMLGRLRPTRLVLRDALDSGRISTIVYSNWRQTAIPPKFLAVSGLDKMKY